MGTRGAFWSVLFSAYAVRLAVWFGLGFFSFFSLMGCVSAGGNARPEQTYAVQQGPGKNALLTIFLNLKEPAARVSEIWMQLASIDIQPAGKAWLPLTSEARTIEATASSRGQFLLVRAVLPVGSYDRLRLNIDKAAITRGEQKVLLALTTPEVELSFPTPLVLAEGDSQSVFVIWDVEESLKGKAYLAPAMSVTPQSIPLTTDLAYVACPEIDTVYIIKTDKNWVTSSLGISGRPTYLHLDSASNKLYILAADEAAIKVIELSSGRLADVIRIPLAKKPVFMALSPDTRYAYIIDGQGSYLIRLDLSTGSLLNKVRIGEQPQYVLYLADIDRLAVSAAKSQEVLLLDPTTLATVATIPIGRDPDGMLIRDEKLYIAESGTNTVTVYNLNSGERQQQHVGFSPRRLFFSNNHLYVSNYRGRSVSVLLPDQLTVLRDIPTGVRPMEMAASAGQGRLYIGSEGAMGLTVVDLTSDRIIGDIELGTTPLGLAVTQ